jgi:hypothetical protein
MEDAAMDEYIVEIDEPGDNLVVLAVPALRLVVFGRTMDEAMSRVRTSIDFRVPESDRRGDAAGRIPVEASLALGPAVSTAA